MSYSTTGSFSSPPSPHESSLLAVTGCFEPFNSATQVHGNWRHIASELVSCDRMSDRTRPSQIPVGSIPVATQTTHTELKLIYGQALAENYRRSWIFAVRWGKQKSAKVKSAKIQDSGGKSQLYILRPYLLGP